MSSTDIAGIIFAIFIVGVIGYLVLCLLSFIVTGSTLYRHGRNLAIKYQHGDLYYDQLCHEFECYAIIELCTQETYDKICEMLLTGELKPVSEAPAKYCVDFLEYVKTVDNPRFKLYIDTPTLGSDKRINVRTCIYGYVGNKMFGLTNLRNFHDLIVDFCVYGHDFKPIRDLILKLDAKGFDVDIPQEEIVKEFKKGPFRRMFGF